MATPFLLTKFNIPQLHGDRVSRPRLLKQLLLGLDRKFTLISAPAGYGKTTLLCEWYRHLEMVDNIRLCWLSLNPDDQQPVRFWSYFIRALQFAFPDLGMALLDILRSSDDVDIRNTLTFLLNEINSLDAHLVLVLDDFHLIQSSSIHQEMVFLLDHLPPQFHLVLASRFDPPFPLARLRAQQEVLELRQDNLRFTAEETLEFLNNVMNLELAQVDLDALEVRTEGWIAGLQMAALVLRKIPSQGGSETISDFIRSFTGSSRFVLDYLVEEVLEQQDAQAREFLLKTSVLERLTASLCDAVVRNGDSQVILSTLERQNLFLIPLDDCRQWYRYHHLFADLLRNQLAQSSVSVSDLHRRASKWYQKQDSILEAIKHALAAKDTNLAADLVEHNVIALKEHGALPEVIRWLDTFPEDVFLKRPWLCVAKSWVLVYLGEPKTAQQLLVEAEKALSIQLQDQSTKPIRGHVEAIRSYLALLDGAMDASIEHGDHALVLLSKDDLQTRISTAITLASALRFQGKLENANGVLIEANALCRRIKDSPIAIRLSCALAALQFTQGNLKLAMNTLEEGIRFSLKIGRDGVLRPHPVAAKAYIRLAKIHLTMYNLDAALDAIRVGIRLGEQWGQANVLWEGYRIYAAVLSAQFNFAESHRAMVKAKEASQRISSRFTDRYTIAQQALLSVVEGDISAAIKTIEQLGLRLDDDVDYFHADQYGIWAYISFAQGKTSDALLLLKKILAVAHSVGAVDLLIGAYILQALIYQETRDEFLALEALLSAISWAEPAAMVSDFVDEGEALQPLLRKLVNQGENSSFVQRLLQMIEGKSIRPEKKTDFISLIESLTERESEVLRLLNTSMDIDQIAQQLSIAVSTTRTHVRNIYAKLGVNRRMEAIQRGKEMGFF